MDLGPGEGALGALPAPRDPAAGEVQPTEGHTDWVAWHRGDDDPDSPLSQRLTAVQRGVASALDQLSAGPIRIVSLCAGDGRDVLPVVAGHGRRNDVSVMLVEFDPDLAAGARDRATPAGLEDAVVVREEDAGKIATIVDMVPVDLLLLCGIFGNITEADIRATVGAVPSLVRPGGFVIWTRGAFAPDLREAIRTMFRDQSCTEVAYDSEPNGYGVGVAQLAADAKPVTLESTARLFTFTR